MLSVTTSLLSEDAVPSSANEVEERKQGMAYHRIMAGVPIALLSMIAVGCAGPTPAAKDDRGDAGVSSPSTAALCGTLQGFFGCCSESSQTFTQGTHVLNSPP